MAVIKITFSCWTNVGNPQRARWSCNLTDFRKMVATGVNPYLLDNHKPQNL